MVLFGRVIGALLIRNTQRDGDNQNLKTVENSKRDLI
jgi:hypothetical protein